MKFKKETIIMFSSLVLLIITIVVRMIIKPIYATWNEIPWYLYLFFGLDLIFFVIFYFPIIDLIDKGKKNRFIRGSFMIAGLVILVGVAMIAFSIIPIGATVLPPVDNSIEEIERFLSEYEIIEFGTSLLINGLIVVFITNVLWFLVHQIYTSLTQKEDSKSI